MGPLWSGQGTVSAADVLVSPSGATLCCGVDSGVTHSNTIDTPH